MAYETHKLLSRQYRNPRKTMLDVKRKQVEYLYDLACDREDDCLLNGNEFEYSPRIYDRKIKTNYYQSLIMETIYESDRFKSGDLLTYDNDYWICTSSFVFHNLYCKGNFIRTNYTLRWLNSDFEIVERRAYVISASQYNSGEEGNKTITLGYNQYMIVLPSDDETISINRDVHFFIDKDKETPIPYRVTRNDAVPYSDWDNGCVCLIVTEDQYNEKTDSIDNWLCDYKEKPTPTKPIEIAFTGNPQIRNGGQAKTFTANTKEPVNWSLITLDTQKDYIVMTPNGNSVKLKCLTNTSLIGSSFKIVCTCNGVESELLIDIVGGV